jgi:hypothetical protein
MSEAKPFRVEVEVRAAGETVWRALTEPELIRQWFGWDYAELDAEIAYIFVEHATARPPDLISLDNGQRIEVEPGAEPGGQGAGSGRPAAESDGAGAEPGGPHGAAAIGTVVVRAVMPGPLDDAAWEDVYDGMEEGWRTFFQQLRFWLEHHPAGRRRTIYLTGRAVGEHVLAAVDLESAGEIWHESRYQRMHVDRDAHLVGVAARQPLTGREPGPISVTVTTYGLDDAAFAGVRERWSAWWRDTADDPEVTTHTGAAVPDGTAG